MENVINSIDEYVDKIFEEELTAMEGPTSYNGNGGNNRQQRQQSQKPKVDPNTIIDLGKVKASRSANMKAINIWYQEFKPKWKILKRQMDTATTCEQQQDFLWKQKKLLLETRDAILNVPEDSITNIVCFTAIIAITLGLACAIFNAFETTGMIAVHEVAHPSLVGKIITPITAATGRAVTGSIGAILGLAPTGEAGMIANAVVSNPGTMGTIGIIAECVGVVYAALKLFALGSKWGDPTHSITQNQKFTGIMSKQLLLVRVNQYIAKVDNQIQQVLSGKVASLNNKVAKAINKFSDDYSEKVIKAASSAGEKVGEDVSGEILKKYFGQKDNKKKQQKGA